MCTHWLYHYYVLYLVWQWLNEPKHVAEFLIVNIDYQHMYWLINLTYIYYWNFFTLLDSSSSSSSVATSSFGCVVILSLYLTLNFVISSLIVGTFKSACRTLLDIYHGAFTIARRTLFSYLCNILIFELLAVPQRGIPYVQMGFRIVLYISKFFKLLVWCGAEGYVSGLQDACWFTLQTVHITHSSTPDQQLENHSAKYHRQQPLYNTLWAPDGGHSDARNMLSKQ